MKITTQMRSITAITMTTSILLSNLRCMKIRRTNDDFIVAINNAIKTVRGPRYI
jgi:hypothetical protein